MKKLIGRNRIVNRLTPESLPMNGSKQSSITRNVFLMPSTGKGYHALHDWDRVWLNGADNDSPASPPFSLRRRVHRVIEDLQVEHACEIVSKQLVELEKLQKNISYLEEWEGMQPWDMESEMHEKVMHLIDKYNRSMPIITRTYYP